MQTYTASCTKHEYFKKASMSVCLESIGSLRHGPAGVPSCTGLCIGGLVEELSVPFCSGQARIIDIARKSSLESKPDPPAPSVASLAYCPLLEKDGSSSWLHRRHF